MARKLAWLFSIAGAAVFAVLAAMTFSTETQVRIPAIAGLVTFAAVILSYLGGIEFGLTLREEVADERTRALALSLSMVPAAAAWGVLWLPSPQWQLGAALSLFVLVWALDLWLARQGLVPAWFVDLRTAITAVVALILGAALFRL